jgi:hypothetical protein
VHEAVKIENFRKPTLAYFNDHPVTIGSGPLMEKEAL